MHNLPRRRALLMLWGSTIIAGCGFQLRGAVALPFETFYTSTAPTSVLGGDLRRAIRAQGARVVEQRDDAQVRLDVLAEIPEREISALSMSGRPREFQLRLRLRWQVRDQAERDLIAATETVLRRTLTVLDAQGVVNPDEEALLYRDMRTDAVQQMIRRLRTVTLPPG